LAHPVFIFKNNVNRWNKLSYDDVDQTRDNGFKRALERRRKVEMDFLHLCTELLGSAETQG